MYVMKHYDPRGYAVLSLHRCAQGHSGRAPLCRNDAADALQVLFVFLHGVVWQNIQYLYIKDAQLSFSRSRVHVCLQALLVPELDFDPGTIFASSFHLS
jgi:hypothetical protein